MAEQDLQKLQMDLLFSVFDALPFPAVLVSGDGETAYANTSCFRHGMDPDPYDWNGLPVFRSCASPSAPKEGIVSDTALLGQQGRLELYPMRDDGGGFMGAIAFFRPAPKASLFPAWFMSASMKLLAERLERAAQMRSPLLIRGMQGTGKSELARLVHGLGGQGDKPFETVYCRQSAAEIEKTLFGTSGEPGALVRARDGTLYLDCVDALPLALQIKLLDVMRNRAVQRPGSDDTLPWTAHLISSAGMDSAMFTSPDRFSEDFLQRISAISVTVPALKDRAEDLPTLAEAYLRELPQNAGISPDALNALSAYNWPGNLAELRQVLSDAAGAAGDSPIQPEHLPIRTGTRDGQTLHQMTSDFSRNRARELVALYGDTTEGKKKAAAELGISLSTLYRRLSKYS